MTYPLAFRKKVFEIKDKESLSYEQTSERFGIGKSSLVRWHKSLEPKAAKNRPSIKLDMQELQKEIEATPDAYQHEIAVKLSVSQSCIHYALKRLDMRFKKRRLSIQKLSRKSKKSL